MAWFTHSLTQTSGAATTKYGTLEGGDVASDVVVAPSWHRPRSWIAATTLVSCVLLILGASVQSARRQQLDVDGVSSQLDAVGTATEMQLTMCRNGVDADDIVFTPESCSEFDSWKCDDLCVNKDCHTLCGEACKVGSGAVCALEQFQPANFLKNCMDLGYCDGLEAPAPTRRRARARRLQEVEQANGVDCDMHAWCEFCAPYDTCVDITLAAANAMIELGNLEQHCQEVGCFIDPETVDLGR